MKLEQIIERKDIEKEMMTSMYSYDFSLKELVTVVNREKYSLHEKQKVISLMKNVSLRFSGSYMALKKNFFDKNKLDDLFSLKTTRDENKFLTAIASEYVLKYSLGGFDRKISNCYIDFSKRPFDYLTNVFSEVISKVDKSRTANSPSKRTYSLLKSFFSSLQAEAVNGLSKKANSFILNDLSLTLGSVNINSLSVLNYYSLKKNSKKEIQLKNSSGEDQFNVKLSNISLNKIVTYDDVQGNYESKNFLRRAVKDLMLYNVKSKINPLLDFGSFNNLVLLAGDAGTGKTFTSYFAISEAKSIAKRFNIPFESVKLNIASSYQDGSLLMLKSQLNEISSSNKAYIVLLDDCEKYFPDRSTSNLDHKKDIVTEFLHFTQGLNGYTNRGNYLLIATSNLPQTLDKALLSRFGDSIFHCEGPVSAEEKAAVLKQNLSFGLENGFVSIKDWDLIGKRAEEAKLKGRDLYNVAVTILGKSRSSMDYESAYRSASYIDQVKKILLNSYTKISDDDVLMMIDSLAVKNNVIESAQSSYVGK